MKVAHRIRVMGRELQVRSSATPESVQAVEAFVNDKLAEVSGALASADSQLVTILALLNVAESYLSLRNEATARRNETDAAAQRMLERIGHARDNGFTVS
jgi:cell division protein ZapA